MRHAAGETITVTRRGTDTVNNDEAGNPIVSVPADFSIPDVALEPVVAEETPGVFSIVGYRIYAPYGTQFRADDRITIRGVSGWQVNGNTEAAGWRSPFDGRGRGIVADVRKAS